MLDPEDSTSGDLPRREISKDPVIRGGLLQRVLFRFTFAYLVLYCLPSLLDTLTWEHLPLEFIEEPALFPWVAVHVFNLSGPVTKYHPTGSGDTTLQYIQVLCFLVISALVTLLWLTLDRGKQHDRILYPWLCLLVRFSIAFTMVSYGFSKVFPHQFPMPDLTRLTETYGESSPMGLVWAFMGASPAYEMFCGWAELMAGLLLLFRRTGTLGALVAAAVILNITVLNFCFDVPVKLYSSHLFLMALFLLIPDITALWNFFVLRRVSELKGVSIPTFERRWLQLASVALQVFVVGNVLIAGIWYEYQYSGRNSETAFQRTPIYGIWDVNGLTGERSDDQSPVRTVPWRRVLIDHSGRIGVRTVDDKLLRFVMTQDAKKNTFKLKGWRNEHVGEFSYWRPDGKSLVLTGSLDNEPTQLQLHRYDPPQFLLRTRGFHWISEDPFNL